MANLTPYRSLPAEQRVDLVKHVISSGREGRAFYIQRLAAKNGFRPTTLQSWPADKLASEVVRTRAETAQDELNLLHLLYVEVAPAIQVTFLDAAGVSHENGVMKEELEPPYASADAVSKGAEAVKVQHGDDGMRYLRTLAKYSADGWPGIGDHLDEDLSNA
ncbi:MAG TPA: hypothetical protein VGM50_04485 [Gemmatimonadaceae bacterium]|jgi:hypothetical protein